MIRFFPGRSIVLLLLFFSVAFSSAAAPANAIPLTQTTKNLIIDHSISFLEDTSGSLEFRDVVNSGRWKPQANGVPNYGVTTSAYWLKVTLRNETDEQKWIIKVAQPVLNEVYFYEMNHGQELEFKTGEAFPLASRLFSSTDFLFPVDLEKGDVREVYFKLRNTDNLQVPLVIGTRDNILKADKNKDIFWGIFIGLILSMLIYNFFIYTTVRDSSYLYYVVYLIALLFTQASIQGYTTYLWPDNVWLATHIAIVSPALVGLAGIAFMRHFLTTKERIPRYDRVFVFFNAAYILGLVLIFSGRYQMAFTLIEICAASVTFYMLILAYILGRRGYRPATFFLIAWSAFLVGIIIYTMKDFNVLPFNNFTVYTMPIGSAMEALLLSFALADRINILKKEKEISQAELLTASRENERIIKEQNVILETMVEKRTHELSETLSDLKEAQAQLVESEKMASLGQLTAGIAHEINNPINFVISNVSPLRRDIDQIVDMFSQIDGMITNQIPQEEIRSKIGEIKEEIEYDYLITEIDFLLNGISDGSVRTAEIVKGLRIFARLDEHDLKRVNINEGLDSTTIIVNSLLNNKIVIQKEYEDLPLVECNAGKLNQVFLNIISNSIHAIREKFKDKPGGVVKIITRKVNDMLEIVIGDNGVGMSEEVQHKVFEPFFTTKEVGEGTGLGLSIVYNVIKKHNGKIQINSVVGEGTEFVLTLPFTQE